MSSLGLLKPVLATPFLLWLAFVCYPVWSLDFALRLRSDLSLIVHSHILMGYPMGYPKGYPWDMDSL